jgi:hypothetical protein
MNDIQQKYLEREERVYLGKVDSIQHFPGMNRVKVTWYVSADPKIQQTIIYWNMRADSVVKSVNRTVSGVMKDSAIVDLTENSYTLEFRNVNDHGESSLYSTAGVSSWGKEYISTLPDREISTINYSFETSLLTLNLSSVYEESVQYAQLKYTGKDSKEVIQKIDNETATIGIPDFPEGGDLYLRTVFFLSKGIDTLVSEYNTYHTPEAVRAQGEKVFSMGSGSVNDLMFAWGENLVHKNAADELDIYTVEGVKTGTIQEILASKPWNTQVMIIFCPPNFLISEDTSQGLGLYTISGNQATWNKVFGGGFHFKTYLPFSNVFFSIDNGGQLKRWNFNANASWATGYNAVIGEGYLFDIAFSYNNQSIIGIDDGGFLWNIPINLTVNNGQVGQRVNIGKGWNGRYERIFALGTKLLCLDAAGDFWLYDDFDLNHYWILE